MYFYGNNLHDIGGNAKLNSCIYWSTNVNHVWTAWSRIGDGTTTCSTGIEIHSTNGSDQYDLHIHDNVVHNTRCNGMVLASIDPSIAPVEVYNNLLYHNGTGPSPSDSGCYYYDAIAFSGNGTPASGTVDVYNNTMYDCGSVVSPPGGATRGCTTMYNQGQGTVITFRYTNNIFYITGSPEAYFNSDALTGQVTGCGNNLYYNGGTAPSYCSTGALSVNPLFALLSTSAPDFHLQSGSLAIGAGSASHMPTWDIDGNARPNPPAIGTYDLPGSSAIRPNPPTNLTIIVR
jgi:hypothetical protein